MPEHAAPPRPLETRRIDPLVATIVFVAALTAIRLTVLALTPLELYPEEAQYWLWSRHLALGYFSKPPMIAWLIRASTLIGGEGTFWVRLPAPIVHGLAALALQRAGARLYDGWSGFWAAILYSLAPGVQLSSGAVATDAPLLLFLSLGLWAYAGFVTAVDRRTSIRCAIGIGVSLGLAFLSKYAAAYAVIGLALHAAIDRETRRRWRGPEFLAAAATCLVLLAPHLAWNLRHGFETVAHLADNADWSGAAARPAAHHALAASLRNAPGFLLAQFGVFGPVPFAAFLIAAVAILRRPAGSLPADRLLLSLALPPLVIVIVQAAVSRANANWAGAAYPAAAVLIAAWLLRRRATLALAAASASQGLIAVVLAGAVSSPALADAAGLANSFKRARGWAASEAIIEQQVAAAAAAGRPFTAVAVSDRFLFNALAYYGRDVFGRQGAPPLRMWVREARPHNEAESDSPLAPSVGDSVLFADLGPAYRSEEMADFRTVEPLGEWTITLDPRHVRRMFLFVGQSYERRPRDPRTGLPVH